MISDPNNFQPASADAQDNGMGQSQHKALMRCAEAGALPVVSSSLMPVPASALLIPRGTLGAVEQPIADVREYLRARTVPVPTFDQEKRLFDKLPLLLKSEVRRLQAAVLFVRDLTVGKTGIKVQPACLRALAVYREFQPLNTFRGKYDQWRKRQDWLVLVNRAKAGAEWQVSQRGLPEAFVEYVAARCGEFKRGDATEQAILSIHRQWFTGRDQRGQEKAIPGYEANWAQRTRALLPDGWSSSNIREQLKKRAKFTAALKAMLHQGCSTARGYLPQVHSTRTDLRFLELVQFDDVRCDFRVMDTDSGQVNDLWLLVARDVATGMLLGFGMRPARARDDGSQEHLKLQDMKQLCGWLLETYGLPPYRMTWVLENGTATLGEAVRLALMEMLGTEPDGSPRIAFQMASMLGGKSALGFWEKAVGNSKAKAMLESLNRLQHMMASHFPGQIGLNYSKIPAEFYERKREAEEIWTHARPEDRAELKYPFYTIPQAREALFEIFRLQNTRTEHDMEGFQEIAEWFHAGRGEWQPAAQAPADMTGVATRTRMESPVERAAGLLEPYQQQFTKVSSEILVAFYEHTQRTLAVSDKGEVQIMVEGKTLRFAPPATEFALAAGRKVLGYFNPDDPRFITLTDGRGAILGTWLRRGLVKHGDREALAAAMRHSTAALNGVKERAHELASGDRAELEAMREHNQQISARGAFIQVAETSSTPQAAASIQSPVARTVKAVMTEKQATKKQQQRNADLRKLAREALKL